MGIEADLHAYRRMRGLRAHRELRRDGQIVNALPLMGAWPPPGLRVDDVELAGPFELVLAFDLANSAVSLKSAPHAEN